jgi:L-lysine exporter family protein LysE/ArgO
MMLPQSRQRRLFRLATHVPYAPAAVLTYFVIGLVIGVLTCIPIGMANVAVIDAAYRHNLSRAIAVGLGGSIADGIYSSLGVFGVGPFLEANPGIPPILYMASGVILLVYGILVARAQPSLPSAEVAAESNGKRGQFAGGVFLGVMITLLNPSAIVTWVVIVGSYAVGGGSYGSLAFVLGVAGGSMLWFVVVAYAADHGKRVLNEKAIWMTRIVALLVAGYGLFSIGRAIWLWMA